MRLPALVGLVVALAFLVHVRHSTHRQPADRPTVALSIVADRQPFVDQSEARASRSARLRALPVVASPPPVTPPVTVRRPSTDLGQFVATCYDLRGTTASGRPAGPGLVAVDPRVIPLGTRLDVEGYGPAVAADTGGAIKGRRVDVWKRSGCAAWGRRPVHVTRLP